MDSYSLFELNEYIRRVIALNFAEPLWIHAEIGQISNSRGQYYISLVEKEEMGSTIVAQSEAVIWYKSVLFLRKKLGGIFESILQQGTQVKCKVRLDHHERYGLKLVIEDIDPKYTIGQLELQRQSIIDKLDKKGLSQLNEQIPLPSVLQKVAVISSETAAGYQDFIKQIEQNVYWYDFDLTLFGTAVQGHRVRAEVCRALKTINENGSFDCVVIIRGGGSKMDLAAFDDYEIGVAIAESDIPVITGIGHQIDNTVADIVSHTSVKTPTAVADFLIEHNNQFEATLLLLVERIYQLAGSQLSNQFAALERLEASIKNSVKLSLTQYNFLLDSIFSDIATLSKQRLHEESLQLLHTENSLELLEPANIIQRGYAAIKQDGKYLSTLDNVNYASKIDIQLMDGTLYAKPIKS